MIKIVLTTKVLVPVKRQSLPLAVVGRHSLPLAVVSMDGSSLAKLARKSGPLAVIKVPLFPHDPRELLDASGGWFMGADGQAVWGAN